jgi:hypothetical protein
MRLLKQAFNEGHYPVQSAASTFSTYLYHQLIYLEGKHKSKGKHHSKGGYTTLQPITHLTRIVEEQSSISGS